MIVKCILSRMLNLWIKVAGVLYIWQPFMVALGAYNSWYVGEEPLMRLITVETRQVYNYTVP